MNAGGTLRDSRAVERERDASEDYVRPRVEKDEVTSEEPMTDVVRKAPERGQDVERHRPERPSFRIDAVPSAAVSGTAAQARSDVSPGDRRHRSRRMRM